MQRWPPSPIENEVLGVTADDRDNEKVIYKREKQMRKAYFLFKKKHCRVQLTRMNEDAVWHMKKDTIVFFFVLKNEITLA